MKRVVQFDVDGVLADFSGAYDATCVKLGIPAPGPEAPWDAKWNADAWDEIRRVGSEWYMDMPTLVDAEAFKRIDNVSLFNVATVYFVTHRSGYRAKAQTEAWLAKHGIWRPTVVVTGKKGEFARAAHVTHAIDDKAGNAVYTAYESPETRSFLIDRPYNRFDPQVLGSKVTRVTTVEQFLDAVEQAD